MKVSSKKDLLNLREASEFLGVSKRTVLRWLESGKLKGNRIGERLIKIPKVNLTRMISSYIPKKHKAEHKLQPQYEINPFLYVDNWAPDLPSDIPNDLAERHDYYLYEQ